MKSNALPENSPTGYYLARFIASPFTETSSATVLLYEGGNLYSFGSRDIIDPGELDYIQTTPLNLDDLEALLDHLESPKSLQNSPFSS